MKRRIKNGWLFTGIFFGLFSFVLAAVPVACRGAEVADRAPIISSTVRVGLVQQTAQVEFSVAGDEQLISASKKIVASAGPGERWQVKWNKGQLDLFKNSQLTGTFAAGPLQVRENLSYVAVLAGSGELVDWKSGKETVIVGADEKEIFSKGDLSNFNVLSAQRQGSLRPAKEPNLITLYTENGSQRYRGTLEFRADEKGLTVINELPIEEYLSGVVPAEMPATWPAQALKAQAVAARSYVLAQLGTDRKGGFDVLATQDSQVYKGYAWENPATNKAVEETRGEVLTFRGLPVEAYFHSSSGGFTENSEDVWKYSLDYIRAKVDPNDRNNTYYNWQVSYTQKQLIDQLNCKGYQFREIGDLNEQERTSTGARVKRLAIKGLNKEGVSVVEEVYNADQVRLALGLKSAFFTMEKEFDRQQKLVKITFRGNGWGHGLGMSQYGALTLARQGYSYQDILQYYYSGVTIAKNYGG